LQAVWKPVAGLRAVSVLEEGDSEGRYVLKVRFSNVGTSPIALRAVHPLHVPAEGSGALALGNEGLRTLVLNRTGDALRLSRVHGEDLTSPGFGVWFTPAGVPVALMGALGAWPAQPVFRVDGSRGKILDMLIDCPLKDFVLDAGGEMDEIVLWISAGGLRARDELKAWAEISQDPLLKAALEDFKPDAPVQEEEETVEVEADLEAEVRQEFEEEIREAMKEPEPEPEPVEESSEAAKQEDGTGEAAPPDAQTAPSILAGAVKAFPRTATFQRALRKLEGVWPRWASGRRYVPMTGMAGRTKDHWRRN
jgi:hypothetical protein